MAELNIKINSPQKDPASEPEIVISLDEMKAPIIEAGQTGKIILPVKAISREGDKIRFVKNGPAESHGVFASQTASEMRKELPVAERDK